VFSEQPIILLTCKRATGYYTTYNKGCDILPMEKDRIAQMRHDIRSGTYLTVEKIAATAEILAKILNLSLDKSTRMGYTNGESSSLADWRTNFLILKKRRSG
jgi:hypothetical protein